MLLSSAYLALVLQCAPTLHPASIHQITDAHSLFKPDAIGIYGEVSPCPIPHLEPAVTNVTQGKQRALGMDLAHQTVKPLQLAEVNLDDQIVPGMTQSSKEIAIPGAVQSGASQQPPQPTYESWDVLRQYPRAAPLAQPVTPAAKLPEPPKSSSKESKDAQGKTATE